MALLKKNENVGKATIASIVAASSAKKKGKKKADALLDFDETKLRSARADKVVTNVSEAAFAIPLADLTEAGAVNAAIGKAAHEAGLKKGTSVAMDLPRSAAVLRQIIVPFVSDLNEINSMVHFQVSRDLPFKAEDAIIDFQIQREIVAPASDETKPGETKEAEKATEPATDSRKLEVLVAAVKKDVLQKFQGAAEAAGLKVAQLGLRSFSSLRALAESNKVSDSEAICLVSLRWDEIVIEVGTGKVLAVSRVVLTAPDIVRRLRPKETPPTDPVKEIISLVNTEVIRTFHSYEGMAWHKPIKEVVIAGELGLEAALAEKLTSRVPVPCSVAPPDEASRFALRGLQILAQEGAPIDFIDPKKPRVITDTKRIKLLVASAACIIILFALFGVRANLVNKRLKAKLLVQNELTEAEKKQPIYRKMRQQVLAIRGWGKVGPTWLDHYAYLSSILPPATDLYVSSLTTSSAGTLRLAVQARTGEILAEMEKRFRIAGYSVKPISITPGSDKFGYNFRTTVELVIPTKFKKIEVDKLKAPPRPEDDTPPATAATESRKNTVATTRP